VPSQVQPTPPGLGPPSLAFAAAPFWALAASPPLGAVRELLEVLSSPEAAVLASAVPPWLPFVSFAALLGAPLGSRNEDLDLHWAWSEKSLRPLLLAFVDQHVRGKDPSVWLSAGSDWLSETLRGLCHRLAIAFLEESFGDKLMARTLWGFAAMEMPSECREVCWGAQDPAILVLLSRSLQVSGPAPGAGDEALFWPLASYLGPQTESLDLVQQAGTVLASVASQNWPALLAAHHRARHGGGASPLDSVCEMPLPAGTAPPGGAAAPKSVLDELE